MLWPFNFQFAFFFSLSLFEHQARLGPFSVPPAKCLGSQFDVEKRKLFEATEKSHQLDYTQKKRRRRDPEKERTYPTSIRLDTKKSAALSESYGVRLAGLNGIQWICTAASTCTAFDQVPFMVHYELRGSTGLLVAFGPFLSAELSVF